MTTVAYLNRWSHLYHLMPAVVDGHVHRRLDSRFCTSLAEAHRILGQWRDEYAIPPCTFTTTATSLDILFAQMDVDIEGVVEGAEAGSIGEFGNPVSRTGFLPRISDRRDSAEPIERGRVYWCSQMLRILAAGLCWRPP